MSIMDTIKGIFSGGAGAAPAIDTSALADKVRQTELFSNLSDDVITAMLAQMEQVAMKDGQAVVSEGAEGDYYYLLAAGTAEVSREGTVLAQLDEGAGFGEEALISNAKRNASIKMVGKGVVLRLSKDSFNDHVKEAVITWISPAAAQKQVNDGARWLDVREDSGVGVAKLRNAISIPVSTLRDSLSMLEKEAQYVCYCQNGRLSSTAVFLLGQRGYNVSVMRGGLQGLERAGLL